MNTIKKAAFPVLLTLTCCAVYCWQHAAASLPYLPLNWAVPLGVLTPALPVLVFFTTLVLLKQTGAPKPALRSLCSALAMLAPILALGVFYLSYLSYRFAAVLPVPVLPDWPTGNAVMLITFVCLAHLTGLLICGLIKRKTPPGRAAAAAAGWLLLNLCLFFVTV